MRDIGIDTENGFVYVGSGTYGYPLLPTPLILPLTIIDESAESVVPTDNSDPFKYPFILVDDGYDPASRVRKGRLFSKALSGQGLGWHIKPHPTQYPNSTQAGEVEKQVYAFESVNVAQALSRAETENPLFLIGSNEQFTAWSLVSAEASVSKHSVLYLKARNSFGIIPKIDYSRIEGKFHDQIRDKTSSLVKANQIAGPEPLVDCVREAAAAIVSSYLVQNGHIKESRDLGQLSEPARNAKLSCVANCVDTLAKFHSRRKFDEQQRRDMRRITEQDAQFAIEALGVIIRDLGWEI